MFVKRLVRLDSLAIILSAGILIGCGPSAEEQAATSVALTVAAATSTPTVTPTHTPTATSTHSNTNPCSIRSFRIGCWGRGGPHYWGISRIGRSWG